MKKIAVFGKPGGGKSTFSKKLSEHTGIKYYSLDLIEYRKNGAKVEFPKKEVHFLKRFGFSSYTSQG